MKNRLTTFKIQDWVVLGRTFFKPPFKVSDTLINEARIVHVIKGRSNFYAANQQIELHSGNTVVMKPDNFINHWRPNETEELNEVIAFQLRTDLIQYIYQNRTPQWLLSKQTERVFPIQKVEQNYLLSNYFENLRYYFDNPGLISEEITQIKIQELIFLLIQTDKSGNLRKIFNNLFRKNEYEFQEVIQAHLFDNLTLKDLAFLTGLSLSSFKRKFTAVYGTSPNKYFISKRLEKAQLLLRTTDLRISEIAYDCGYSDVSHFIKTFQKNYHYTPSIFREKLLGQ